MEHKLKSQIAWLENLVSGANFDGDPAFLRFRITENRKYFQHERLVHLLVTIGTGIIMMLVFSLFVTHANLLYGALFLILLILETAWLIHYYRLENGVQKLWELEQHWLEKQDIGLFSGADVL